MHVLTGVGDTNPFLSRIVIITCFNDGISYTSRPAFSTFELLKLTFSKELYFDVLCTLVNIWVREQYESLYESPFCCSWWASCLLVPPRASSCLLAPFLMLVCCFLLCASFLLRRSKLWKLEPDRWRCQRAAWEPGSFAEETPSLPLWGSLLSNFKHS